MDSTPSAWIVLRRSPMCRIALVEIAPRRSIVAGSRTSIREPMKIRTLIVDDEALARDRIRMLLADTGDVEVIGECADGESAVKAILELHPDLVFLDIQMPGLNGLGVVERVGTGRMPTTVFATAFDDYAIQAFEAHAADYLLKPFDEDRFRQTLDRVRERLAAARSSEVITRLDLLLRNLSGRRQFLERFIVRTGARITIVAATEVDWIESDKNYARLHSGKQSHLIRETLSRLEEMLDPTDFVRVHRSAIVRIDRVRQLESIFQGEYAIILRDGTRVVSTRSYRERLEASFGLT